MDIKSIEENEENEKLFENEVSSNLSNYQCKRIYL